jgi:hypothetical protein
MSWLVDILAGPGAAGITGLVGGVITKFTELKAQREKYAFDSKMRELDIEEAKLEREHELDLVDKQIDKAEVEGAIRINEGELAAFTVSQEHGNKVEGLLKFVRPAVTSYLLLAVTALFAQVWVAVGGLEAFDKTELVVMLKDMVAASLYLTVLAVGWWFGSRGGNLFKSK